MTTSPELIRCLALEHAVPLGRVCTERMQHSRAAGHQHKWREARSFHYYLLEPQFAVVLQWQVLSALGIFSLYWQSTSSIYISSSNIGLIKWLAIREWASC